MTDGKYVEPQSDGMAIRSTSGMGSSHSVWRRSRSRSIHKLLTGNFISLGGGDPPRSLTLVTTTDAILSPENRRIYLSLSGAAAAAAESSPGLLRHGILPCHSQSRTQTKVSRRNVNHDAEAATL